MCKILYKSKSYLINGMYVLEMMANITRVILAFIFIAITSLKNNTFNNI